MPQTPESSMEMSSSTSEVMASANSIEMSGTSNETDVADSEGSSKMVGGAPFLMDWRLSAVRVRGGSA